MMRKILTVALLATIVSVPSPAVSAITRISAPTAVTFSLTEKTVTLVPPTSNSPGTWAVEIDNPKIAVANGLTITLLAPGTSIIRYAQSASGAYNASARSSRLTVTPGLPTLGEFKDQNATLSQGNFTLTPPTSDSDGTWSYTSLDLKIATVSGNRVTLLDGGEVSIRATQSATVNWLATSATMKLNVIAPSPIVGSFSDITLSIDSVSKVELILPSSTSNGAWTLISADPSVASVSGLTVTAHKAGITKISAKQVPSGGYRSIIVTLNVTILAVDPVVTSTNFGISTIEITPGVKQQVSLVAPVSNSTGTWSFTSSDLAVASITGNSLTALKPGKVTITAIQRAKDNFAESAPVVAVIIIKGRQMISSPVNIEKLAGDPDIVIAFPASESLGRWSASSSDTSVATIAGNSVKLGNAGIATITLIQEATELWASSAVTYTVRVLGITPTLGAFPSLEVGQGEKLLSPVTASSNSSGKWIYKSSDSTVVTVIDNEITGVAVGTATISAFQQPAGKYGQSNTLQTTIIVKESPTVGVFSNLQARAGDPLIKLTVPTSNSTGAWRFVSKDPDIVVVTDNQARALKAGVATIIATQASSGVLASVSRAFTITVAAMATLTPLAKAKKTKRVIKFTVKNTGSASVIATIDSKVVKIGKNKVKPGKRTARVFVGGRLIYSKTFKIK